MEVDIPSYLFSKQNTLKTFFILIVKPGDEPNYPKIPTSPSELWGSATDLFSAAKDKISTVTISGDKAK